MIVVMLSTVTVAMLPRSTFKRHPFSLLCSNRIAVFDDVFDANTLALVDASAKDGGLGHTVFDRRTSPPRTAVEASIVAALRALGDDDANIIEYWWREEWMHLELHRDVDELLARAHPDAPMRVPAHAHVLYLSVGDHVQGPTVVLLDTHPRKMLPDGSLAPIASGQRFSTIILVPAVVGRLLRFDGSLMHAVPRPALAYLDPEEGGSNLELWTRRRPVSDDDPERTVNRRSVLLFNTWKIHAPLDVSTDPPGCSANVNVDVPVQCNARDSWVVHACEEPVDGELRAADDSRLVHLKVGLLGDQTRRERRERYLHLTCPVGIKGALLGDTKAPRSFSVQESSQE